MYTFRNDQCYMSRILTRYAKQDNSVVHVMT